MDVGPVREQNVCGAMVQHKPKEGSLWWKVCGGTGAHTHQGLIFCERVTQSAANRINLFLARTHSTARGGAGRMLLARSVLWPTSWPGAAAPGSQKPPGGGCEFYKKKCVLITP
jgi:hypothetical protein